MSIDPHVCPMCSSEDTYMEDDLLYERNTIIRHCNACHGYYEVIYFPHAIKETRKYKGEMPSWYTSNE